MLARRQWHCVAAATAVGAVTLAAAGQIPAAAAAAAARTTPLLASPSASVVLGRRRLFGRYGAGWGTARPRKIFNGGGPSGLVTNLRWKHWGGRVAVGIGLTSLYKPRGGYYRRRGAIQLRASGRGSCRGTGGKRAYTHLDARVPSHPGGRFGRWFSWAGLKSICTLNYLPYSLRTGRKATRRSSHAARRRPGPESRHHHHEGVDPRKWEPRSRRIGVALQPASPSRRPRSGLSG